MSAKIIVSYDDTDNDRDALALGAMLAGASGSLTLAYVRHDSETTPQSLAQSDAEALLARGVELIGREGTKSVVLNDPSTSEGLAKLAESEEADVIVFGSDYRTARGSVIPGRSALALLQGCSTAVALAPADFRMRHEQGVAFVGVNSEGDSAPGETASSLAASIGAQVAEKPPYGLLVVGSRNGAPVGRLEIGALAEYQIEIAHTPVVVVPREKAITF